MKFLICGINFHPELVGTGKYTGELVDELVGRGHEVRVITAPPHYPSWEVAKDHNSLWYRTEVLGGAQVTRCPLYVPRNPSGLRRILHYASFTLTSFPILIFSALNFRPHVVLCIEPTIAVAPSVLLASWVSRAVSWLHIQDFEVEAAAGLGIISRSGGLVRFLRWIDRMVTSRFKLVTTISSAMMEGVAERSVSQDNRMMMPNWADLDGIRPIKAYSDRQRAIDKESSGAAPAKVTVLYAGAIGVKQGLELLIDAAPLVQSTAEIEFVVCGDGPALKKLQEKAEFAGVRITFLRPKGGEAFGKLLRAADVHLVLQKPEAAALVLPSKVTNILSAGGSMVVTAEDGTDLQKIVRESGAGICVVPESPDALADAITTLIDDPLMREEMGSRARQYAEDRLGKQRIIGSVLDKLDTIASARPTK